MLVLDILVTGCGTGCPLHCTPAWESRGEAGSWYAAAGGEGGRVATAVGAAAVGAAAVGLPQAQRRTDGQMESHYQSLQLHLQALSNGEGSGPTSEQLQQLPGYAVTPPFQEGWLVGRARVERCNFLGYFVQLCGFVSSTSDRLRPWRWILVPQARVVTKEPGYPRRAGRGPWWPHAAHAHCVAHLARESGFGPSACRPALGDSVGALLSSKLLAHVGFHTAARGHPVGPESPKGASRGPQPRPPFWGRARPPGPTGGGVGTCPAEEKEGEGGVGNGGLGGGIRRRDEED